MEKVILYSTNCPKCRVLEAKLKQKSIEYETINDVGIMQEKGFEFAPVLEIDGVIYDFKKAIERIGGQ